VLLVTELSGERLPDEDFAIQTTQPGVTITDETATVAASDGAPPSETTLTYTSGKTPAETARNREEARTLPANVPIAPLPPAIVQPEFASESPPESAVPWLILVNGAVIVLIGGIVAYRRYIQR
jgi:hypothetical protein